MDDDPGIATAPMKWGSNRAGAVTAAGGCVVSIISRWGGSGLLSIVVLLPAWGCIIEVSLDCVRVGCGVLFMMSPKPLPFFRSGDAEASIFVGDPTRPLALFREPSVGPRRAHGSGVRVEQEGGVRLDGGVTMQPSDGEGVPLPKEVGFGAGHQPNGLDVRSRAQR